MQYQVTSDPGVEPISRTEAKNYLKVDTTADDDLIDDLIIAARQYVESLMGLAFITQTIEVVYDGWGMVLPLSNAQSVATVKYYDGDGDLQTWASSNYVLDSKGKPNCISRKPGVTLPTLYNRPSPIEVVYVAGFGDAASDVPREHLIPIYKVLSEWYEMREDKPWEKVTASRYLIRKNAVWAF